MSTDPSSPVLKKEGTVEVNPKDQQVGALKSGEYLVHVKFIASSSLLIFCTGLYRGNQSFKTSNQ